MRDNNNKLGIIAFKERENKTLQTKSNKFGMFNFFCIITLLYGWFIKRIHPSGRIIKFVHFALFSRRSSAPIFFT